MSKAKSIKQLLFSSTRLRILTTVVFAVFTGIITGIIISSWGGSTKLEITLYSRVAIPGSKTGASKIKTKHYVLSCDPAKGTVRDPERACEVLDNLSDPFGPGPRMAFCSTLALGSKQADVTGSVRGNSIDAYLSQGGCGASERWERVQDVVPGFRF